METLGQVPGQSDLAIYGDHRRIGWVDGSAIEVPRSPAALYNSANLSRSCQERWSPETTNGICVPQTHTTFSDYISDINIVDEAQFDPEMFFRDIQDCSTEIEGTVRNQPQLNDGANLAEVENILLEDFWAGDKFRSQMLTELVPKSSGGDFTFDTPPSQAIADSQN
ncbi:hypothetical protein N7474_010638 [Penicillium riverlandense]|uniref:uncharacterized protein n=1 Tax=Penicillium riverlandense TaxID=1903569 RepID=UPI002547BF45|nr:uncharacterized protein N7474_010638 [Penicillium riverlandense]KAJ5807046.1 hypothetical protein N7474_010638 [Penicillium riverlandense]